MLTIHSPRVRSFVHNFAMPDARFHQVHIHTVELLESPHGNTYILTCINLFTGWSEPSRISVVTPESVTRHLVKRWIGLSTATPESATRCIRDRSPNALYIINTISLTQLMSTNNSYIKNSQSECTAVNLSITGWSYASEKHSRHCNFNFSTINSMPALNRSTFHWQCLE